MATDLKKVITMESNSILKALGTNPVIRNILYYPSLFSTMDVAREMVTEGMNGDLIVIADEQTLGRGRMGRKWLSKSGDSLLLSIVLHPALVELPMLNMAASLAIVQTIQEVTGLNSGIKWPNDVLLNGRKVSGILIDNIIKDSTVRTAIVGIGINITLCPSEFPEISDLATSLSDESDKSIRRSEVLQKFLKKFSHLLCQFADGRKVVYESWLTHVETLGKLISVRSGNNTEEGYAESIDFGGNLLLRRLDGSLITVVAGEVTLHKED